MIQAIRTPKRRRKKWADDPQPRPQYKFRRLKTGMKHKDWRKCCNVVVEYVPERIDRVPIRCAHGPGNAPGGRCIVTLVRGGTQFHMGFMGLTAKYEPVDEDGYRFLELHGIGRCIYESVDSEIRGRTG